MRILSHPSKRYSPAIFWLSARPRKAEPRIEKIARCTRDVRAIFVDCILVLVIFFAIGLFFQQVFTSATFVEPIDAPSDQQDIAKSMQSKIEIALYNIENEASSVTPGTIKGKINADFNPPRFSHPRNVHSASNHHKIYKELNARPRLDNYRSTDQGYRRKIETTSYHERSRQKI